MWDFSGLTKKFINVIKWSFLKIKVSKFVTKKQ